MSTTAVTETKRHLPPVDVGVADEVILGLRGRLEGLTAETKEGYELVRTGIAECRTLRTDVEKARKKLKQSALEYGRTVDSEAKRVTAMIVDIEEPLKLEKKKIDDEKERKKREREEKARLEREAKERAERELREAEERAERERIAEEQRAERERLEAEAKKLEEEMRAHREKLAAEQAEITRQREELEAEQAAVLAEKLEKERIEREELEAEKRRLEAVELKRKQAELKPIYDAFRAFMQGVVEWCEDPEVRKFPIYPKDASGEMNELFAPFLHIVHRQAVHELSNWGDADENETQTRNA